MNARPHNLTVLISTLVLTLTLAGCGYSPPSETTVTCQSLAPGETPDGLNTAAWTSGWERRYADHRGRYICKYESTGGCVETTDVVLYQFACTDGRCSCEVGGTWSEKPYRSARFTATAKEAFTSAASACEFDHRLASMEAPPSKPASGKLYTLVGDGKQAQTDGSQYDSSLDAPTAVADDGQGSLLVASAGSHQLRLVKAGQVETVGDSVYGYADGNLPTAQFQNVRAMVSDRAGKVYLADKVRIRIIAHGAVLTVAGNGTIGCMDGPALSATFGKPVGLALSKTGALYIADEHCKAVRVLDKGVVTTLVGNPVGKVLTGPVADVRLNTVKDVALDGKGRVHVLGDHQVKLIEKGQVSDVKVEQSGKLNHAGRLVTDRHGDVLVVATSFLWKMVGGGYKVQAALTDLRDPRGATLDSKGNLLIADRAAHRVFTYLP